MAIKAIIGLGNPGHKFWHNRHNIGFLVVDQLVDKHHGDWRMQAQEETAEISLNNHPVLVVKPQTFMNSSGKVIPMILKKGIKPEEILVVHDELELPFGKIAVRQGGSAKGHNGLKSIIAACGENFYRLRCGIGRPENKEDVPDYVLSNFLATEDFQSMIADAVEKIESMFI